MKTFFQRCFVRWKHHLFGTVLSFILALAGSVAIGMAGKYSNFTYRTEVASLISDAAAHSLYGEVQLSLAAKSGESRTDYIELFNQAQAIDDMNFNRLKFTCWSLYDRGNPLFSESWGISFNGYGFGDDEYNENLSLLASPVHSNNETTDGFVHEIYKFQTIFEKNHLAITTGCTNFFFIPQSLANEILLKEGIAEPTTDDYATLVGRPFEFKYENYVTGEQSVLRWSVANIFVENDLYLEANANFGPFVVCYFGLPNYIGGSISLTMRKSVFSNRWYLDKLNDICPQTDYVYSLNLRTTEGLSSSEVNASFLDLYSQYGEKGSSMTTFFVVSLVVALLMTALAEIVLLLLHKAVFRLTYGAGFALGIILGIFAVWYVLSWPSSWTLYFQLMSLLIFVVVSAIFAFAKSCYTDKLRLFPDDTIRI